MRLQFPLFTIYVNLHIIIFDMDSGFRQYRVIERTERVEVFRIHLGRAVSPHQMIFKEDAHFRYERPPFLVLCDGNLDAGHQVFLSVRAKYTYGKL